MLGLIISRTLIMVFGYAYPAYECYKVVELNKPKLEQLLFWCQYWILVAVITICERFGDTLISWFPFYNEAKLALFIYLWHPSTRGTTYIYDSFFQPLVAEHEAEIDRNLLELKVNSKGIALKYFLLAMSFGQKRFFEILRYVSTQSAVLSRENHNHQLEEPNATIAKLPNSDPVTKQAEEIDSPLARATSNKQLKGTITSETDDESPSPKVVMGSFKKRNFDASIEKAAPRDDIRHRRRGKWNLFQSD